MDGMRKHLPHNTENRFQFLKPTLRQLKEVGDGSKGGICPIFKSSDIDIWRYRIPMGPDTAGTLRRSLSSAHSSTFYSLNVLI